VTFKEWLWDHMRPDQIEDMADILSKNSNKNIEFLEYFLSIKSGKFVEIISKKILKSLFDYMEIAKKISDEGLLKIEFSMRQKSLEVHLADMLGKNRFKLPEDAARTVAEEFFAHRT